MTASLPTARADTVLITGSNRGIGLEFVKQYAALGSTVIATARAPEAAVDLKAVAASFPSVRVEPLDVTDVASIKALAAKYAGTSIDVLINNAGVLIAPDRQRLGNFGYDAFQNAMAVNTFGPLAVSEAFLPQVLAGDKRKIIGITSSFGIISAPASGGSYYYKASKIGLNMVLRVLAADLAREGVIVCAIAPGAVNTDMRREAVGAEVAARDLPVDRSVGAMIKVIAGLSRADSGRALNYDGRVLPW